MSSPAIKNLIAGYQQFFEGHYTHSDPAFAELVHQGQKPKVLMISCCDSRLDPALIMGCQPGDMFVVRSVANLVPPNDLTGPESSTLAAIEFAVKGLQVEEIIVMGHGCCGGIKALVERHNGHTVDFPAVERWMEVAAPAFEKHKDALAGLSLEAQAAQCERYALVESYQNLLTFPWIQSRVAAGQLNLHAWYFDLKTGQLHALREEDKTFTAIK